MKVRTAIRKPVKWGGAVTVVLFVAVWVASGWWWAQVWFKDRVRLSIGDGCVATSQYDLPAPTGLDPAQPFLSFDVTRSKTLDILGALTVARPEPQFDWWFHREVWNTSVVSCTSTTVPLWFPTLLILIPTTLAWRADRRAIRRARLGLCPTCGYDRRGIASDAVCPECGAAANAAVAS